MSTISAAMRRLVGTFFNLRRPESALDSFNRALKTIGTNDIVIDCGANIGLFTVPLARTGAQVYGFEPDPVAFELLEARTREFNNVTIFNAAVSNVSGIVRLYFHESREQDPVGTSTGSSLLSSKTNVDSRLFVDVDAVRLSDFITKVGHIKLLKIDIEGHEIEVLNDLLDTDAINNVDLSFVELHDRKNPHLGELTDRLRERIRQRDLNVDLTWH